MGEGADEPPVIKPTDLRSILRYVPLFRDQVFVIAVDGAAVEDENFANLLLDLAVLRNLGIRLLVAHGIGHQLEALAGRAGTAPSDLRGEGPTDAATLGLAVTAAGEVAHRIHQGLARTGLTCVRCQPARATEVGVIGGVDHQLTGKVEKVDAALVRHLLDRGTVPLVSPLAFDAGGNCLRLNSDHLATQLAAALGASKLIFISAQPGLTIDGQFLTNVPVDEVRKVLEERPEAVDPAVLSKARQAVWTIDAGTPRVHLIDGRVYEGLITEVFSKVGIGTMVHGNAYQQIRPARRADAQAIYNLVHHAARTEHLRERTREAIEAEAESYFLYEIDGGAIACAQLVPYPAERAAEVSSVVVLPHYQGEGAGRKLVEFAAREAARQGFTRLFALTTQSYGFFKRASGFEDATPDDLPPARRAQLEASGRNSKVLCRRLEGGGGER